MFRRFDARIIGVDQTYVLCTFVFVCFAPFLYMFDRLKNIVFLYQTLMYWHVYKNAPFYIILDETKSYSYYLW